MLHHLAGTTLQVANSVNHKGWQLIIESLKCWSEKSFAISRKTKYITFDLTLKS